MTGSEAPFADTTALDEIIARSCAASGQLAQRSREERGRLLRGIADSLEDIREHLIDTAADETNLGRERLASELQRTTDQFRFFAQVAEEGSYLEVAIDHATARTPDVRRTSLALGVVAVFEAGNFPFAFGLAGGDTASALAAGCSVVVKVHPDHEATSLAALGAIRLAAVEAALDPDIVTAVHGLEAGRALVTHPTIAAVAFTGSTQGGRALYDVTQSRPSPIPFYGELGSINPLIITEEALTERADEICDGLASSVLGSMGQLCTKPGYVLVPSSIRGSQFTQSLTERFGRTSGHAMLSSAIEKHWRDAVQAVSSRPGVTVRGPVSRPSHAPAPTVLSVAGAQLLRDEPARYLDECFGPSVLVTDYRDESELLALIDAAPPALTGSVHAATTEGRAGTVAHRAMERLLPKVGRLVWNQYPTGVAVNWAMQHGGPYPVGTVPSSTSVGAASILRFVRPIALQNVPEALLPAELLDDRSGLSRRVDGTIETT